MFKTTVQPPLVSLFSSVGSHPLQLFSTHVDSQLPEDSFIQLLNDATSLPAPLAPGQLLHPPKLPLIPCSTSTQSEERSTHSCEGIEGSLQHCIAHTKSHTSVNFHPLPPSGWRHEPGFEAYVEAPTSLKYGQRLGVRDRLSGCSGSGGQGMVCDFSGSCLLSTDSSPFHFDTLIDSQSLRGMIHQDHLF